MKINGIIVTNNLKTIDNMKKWIICYEDKHGDTSKVWTEANDEEDAIDYVMSEYWDIEEIIYVKPM